MREKEAGESMEERAEKLAKRCETIALCMLIAVIALTAAASLLAGRIPGLIDIGFIVLMSGNYIEVRREVRGEKIDRACQAAKACSVCALLEAGLAVFLALSMKVRADIAGIVFWLVAAGIMWYMSSLLMQLKVLKEKKKFHRAVSGKADF